MTERLELRPWSAADAGLLGRLGRMPEVTRHVGDGSTWDAERVAERALAAQVHWEQHGFGWRRVARRDTRAAIGFVALNFAGAGTPGVASDEVEIGWWLDPRAWGRGYAREAAAAVRDEAFSRLAAPSLIARIQPPNRASIAVAQALGMRHDFDSHGRFGEPLGVWRATAPSNFRADAAFG